MRRTLAALALIATAMTTYAQTTEIEPRIQRYREDLGSIQRTYPLQLSENRAKRFIEFYSAQLKDLQGVDFDKLSHDGQIDYLLLQNEIRHAQRTEEIEAKRRAEAAPLLPFSSAILTLEETRRRMEGVDGAKAAATLNELAKAIGDARAAVEAALNGQDGKVKPSAELKALLKDPKDMKFRSIANRAATVVGTLDRHLDDWYRFYNGYDPMFTWWCEAPYKVVDQAIKGYADFIRERLVGVKPDDKITIIGFPIGAEALQAELDFERVPYTAAELVEIANKEFAWCDAEMLKASRELGFGDDWHKAMEHVKQQFVPPGDQPKLIRELALEAIEFLEKRDLVTIPELAKETWRMDMMSPERQLVSPFFLGGESIIVSYPTNTMSHEAKLMSMRGNNRYFSRATVQHELIPGHHLQGFMTDRYRPYRGLFNTPFWIEGWALYWEMRLWDMNFPARPEEKIGMLFWRMHRCARIIFSLSFHLGKMTPQECVDFLVDRVGHERDNATAEVRRSFAGDYGPLYQAAYMLGGLQIRAMHEELVKSKKMTERQFHDAILQNGPIPIEWVRATLSKSKLSKDSKPDWRFYKGL